MLCTGDEGRNKVRVSVRFTCVSLSHNEAWGGGVGGLFWCFSNTSLGESLCISYLSLFYFLCHLIRCSDKVKSSVHPVPKR